MIVENHIANAACPMTTGISLWDHLTMLYSRVNLEFLIGHKILLMSFLQFEGFENRIGTYPRDSRLVKGGGKVLAYAPIPENSVIVNSSNYSMADRSLSLDCNGHLFD